jgi:hypothetical protein
MSKLEAYKKKLFNKIIVYINKYNFLFAGLVVNVLIFWLSLSLGFCTYKEIIFLDSQEKDAVITMFPKAILILTIAYLFTFLFKKKKNRFLLNIYQYIFVIISCIIIFLLFFINKESYIIISYLLGIIYFIVFSLLLWWLNIICYYYVNINLLEKRLHSILYKHIITYKLITDNWLNNIKKNPSSSAFTAFIILLFVCSIIINIKILLPLTEFIANTAFILFVIGIVIETYKILKNNAKSK